MAWTASVVNYVRASNGVDPFTGASTDSDIDYPQSQAPESLANGTGANQIDLAWTDQRSYNTSGTTLDLTALAAASTNIGAATFSAVKYLGIWNNDATNDLVVGNAASVQFTPGFSAATTTWTIQEGGNCAFYNDTAAGWDCTTNKNLKLTSSASTVTGTVIILGED